MGKSVLNKIFFVLPIVGLIGFGALIIYGYTQGIFTSVASLHQFINGYGELAVFVFIGLQMLQVVVPILPGGISTLAGMLMFGNWPGLFYSYVGLLLGEIMVYWLTRYYGRPFAPDDLVCLVADLADFPFREYLKLLLVLKFWSVATYGFLLLYLSQVAGLH